MGSPVAHSTHSPVLSHPNKGRVNVMVDHKSSTLPVSRTDKPTLLFKYRMNALGVCGYGCERCKIQGQNLRTKIVNCFGRNKMVCGVHALVCNTTSRYI